MSQRDALSCTKFRGSRFFMTQKSRDIFEKNEDQNVADAIAMAEKFFWGRDLAVRFLIRHLEFLQQNALQAQRLLVVEGIQFFLLGVDVEERYFAGMKEGDEFVYQLRLMRNIEILKDGTFVRRGRPVTNLSRFVHQLVPSEDLFHWSWGD